MLHVGDIYIAHTGSVDTLQWKYCTGCTDGATERYRE